MNKKNATLTLIIGVVVVLILTAAAALKHNDKTKVQPDWLLQESLAITKIFQAYISSNGNNKEFSDFMSSNFSDNGKLKISNRPGQFINYEINSNGFALTVYGVDPSSCVGLYRQMTDPKEKKIKNRHFCWICTQFRKSSQPNLRSNSKPMC